MEITGDTGLFGLFGYPIKQTLSPLIHNTAFREAGLNSIYLPFPVKPSNLQEAIQAIKALGITGINVTSPHKEKIIGYLDQVSPEVQTIGAVNTVSNHKGKLIGHNTDGKGFVESLREKSLSLKDKQVLLLGAGGAALSVSFFLIKEKVGKLIIANRTHSRAENMLKKLEKISNEVKLEVIEFRGENPFFTVSNVDFLINATSLGMRERDSSPVDLKRFPSSLYVYDLISTRETELLKQAKKEGMEFQGGLDMLVYQAAFAFEIWTGKKAPVDKMKKAVAKFKRNK